MFRVYFKLGGVVFVCLIFLDQVPPYNPGWPETHYVTQAGLQLVILTFFNAGYKCGYFFLSFFFLFLSHYWGLNWGPHTCCAGTLLPEPLHQPNKVCVPEIFFK
jgi:hypothetical protein